jgi:hypothetical protein
VAGSTTAWELKLVMKSVTSRAQQRRWRLVTVASLAMVACLVLVAEATACPTCKEAIAGDGGNHSNLVQGYFWSIIFMLSVPPSILLGLGTYFYLLVRRARRLDPAGTRRQFSVLNQPLDPERRKQLEQLAHAP